MTARAAQALRTGLRRLTTWIGVASLVLWAASVAAQDITVTPSSIPTPALGVPYSVTFVASDGVAPYQFLVSAGLLPAGLSLSGTGDLTGTPTSSAPYSFTITVSDALGRELDLLGAGTVTGALTVTPPPVLVANTAYSGQIQVTWRHRPLHLHRELRPPAPGHDLGAQRPAERNTDHTGALCPGHPGHGRQRPVLHHHTEPPSDGPLHGDSGERSMDAGAGGAGDGLHSPREAEVVRIGMGYKASFCSQ